MADILLLPGLWNSGPDHWQSHWARLRGCRIVQQTEWQAPRREEWVATLEAAMSRERGPAILVGHSTGCALIAFWAQQTAHAGKVRGALLVGPSDTEAPSYPKGPTGFAPMPLARLPFPSIAVMSSDDEYVSPERAALFARSWGARLVSVGARGHINSDSKLGNWDEGWAILQQLDAPAR